MADTSKPITGLTAKVSIGEEDLAYVSGCTLSLSKDIIEIIAFGKTYKEKVPAIKDWTLSIDGTAALAADSTQDKLLKAFESGDTLIFKMYLNDTTLFTGNGLVSSFELDAAPDDKISLKSEVAGTGATTLSYTG